MTRTLLLLDKNEYEELYTAPVVGDYDQDVYEVAFIDAAEVHGTASIKAVTFLTVKDSDDDKQIEEMLVIESQEMTVIDITDDSRFEVDLHGASFRRL